MKDKKTKSEKRAFLLFKDRCEKLGYQYFVDLNIQYPMVFWWHKGLSKQQCLEQGCAQTVANIDHLWDASYRFMKLHLTKWQS